MDVEALSPGGVQVLAQPVERAASPSDAGRSAHDCVKRSFTIPAASLSRLDLWECRLKRIATSLLMLIGLVVCAPAFGQVVQYQFTPPPPVTPLPFHPFESPSTLQIPNVVPPDRVLKRARPPGSTALNSYEAPRYVPHRGRVVPVPPAAVPGQNNYSDRMARCAQAGAAAGIGANHLGAFTTQCANY
jgi:hypothetical protein